MGLGTSRGVALVGMTGHVVGVEAHLAATVPGFTLIGLPDASLSESRDRVRAAVASSGLAWPQQRVTVNLSPASLPKHGAGFDLAIAVAVLAGARLVDATAPRGVAFGACPPVLEYTIVSSTSTFMLRVLARTWSSPP